MIKWSDARAELFCSLNLLLFLCSSVTVANVIAYAPQMPLKKTQSTLPIGLDLRRFLGPFPIAGGARAHFPNSGW